MARKRLATRLSDLRFVQAVGFCLMWLWFSSISLALGTGGAERNAAGFSVRAKQVGAKKASTAQASTTQASTTQASTAQASTAQISTTQASTAQASTAQISTTQISTTQISTTQISTTQISTRPHQSKRGSGQRDAVLGQYIRRSVVAKVSRNWTPIRTVKVVPIKMKWKIYSNGAVADIRICNTVNSPLAEKRAIDAVRRSAPFDSLPHGGPEFIEVDVQFETTTALRLTVPQAIKHYAPTAREILRESCKLNALTYPPARLTIIGLKEERRLLLFGGNNRANHQMKLIGSYPLVSYSGVLGPKLKEGDLQIPEGIYRMTGFQAFNMLALCVNYPNELDRKNATTDHRTNLGSDILIHGGSHSTGCLVVSDEDMEQVFVAVHDVGCSNCELIIAPCDLTRFEPAIDAKAQPSWVPALYHELKGALKTYPLPR